MASKVRAIKAKVPNVGKARLALLNEIRKVGKEIKEDFSATTATWQNKPAFKLSVSLAGGEPSAEVSTTDEIYGYVDEGTRPHVIVPVKAKILRFPGTFSAKTTPGVIGSSAGSKGGDMVFAHAVKHPGTKARGFSKKIAAKWRGTFGKRMAAAMHEAALASGHSLKG